MDVNFIWQAVLIVLIGTILLRVAGRKTISEMTLAETVLMISIGTLIIQPVTSESVGKSFLVGIVLVLTLLMLEFAQIKSNRLEKIITGKSQIIIENGQIKKEKLAKLHLTIDQLEMHLRQNKVTSVSDVKIATLEPSGRVGIMLKEEAQPATKKDIEQLQQSINELIAQLSQDDHIAIQKSNQKRQPPSTDQTNLFFEVQQYEQNNQKDLT